MTPFIRRQSEGRVRLKGRVAALVLDGAVLIDAEVVITFAAHTEYGAVINGIARIIQHGIGITGSRVCQILYRVHLGGHT